MRLRLTFILALSTILPAAGQDVPFAERPASRMAPPADSGVPKLGDIMASTELRHSKLWYSGSLKNWPLAAYELGQIRSSFFEAAALYVNIPADALGEMISKPMDALAGAIAEKDAAKFTRSFSSLTAGCNSCHQMAGVGFIVMKIPTASPFGNQAFEPGK